MSDERNFIAILENIGSELENSEDIEIPTSSGDEKVPNVIMRRTNGRPKFVKSGSRGRPGKIYQTIVEKANLIEEPGFCLNSEVPMKHALSGTENGLMLWSRKSMPYLIGS
ncbi:hypothetical protein Trydic_g8948 [Trypoxylus dichotomus]